METKHIQRDDSPDGVWINVRDFDPNIHKLWVETVPEIIKTVEVADLQEAIAPKKVETVYLQEAIAPKKTARRKVL